MNYPERTPTIHAALLAAQQSIRAVAKDATNNHQRYDYVSAENMIQHCRDALHRHGLTLTAGDVVLAPLPADEPGGVVVSIGYRLTGGAEAIEISRDWPAVPGKGRPLDKAVAAALTACLSYTLRDLLLIPRGDEAGVGMDHTDRSDAGPVAAPERAHAGRGRATPPRPAERATGRPTGAQVAESIVSGGEPECPHCQSRVWDNREQRRKQQADHLAGIREKQAGAAWKCSNKQCGGGRNGYPWSSFLPDQFGEQAGPVPVQAQQEQPPPLDPADCGLDERGESFGAEIEVPF